jgi:hypothetical protein
MQPGKPRWKQLGGALLLLLVLASCKKEIVPPDIKEEPMFFVKGRFNGQNIAHDVGVDSCTVAPATEMLDAIIGDLPSYSSSITRGGDRFTVILVGNEIIQTGHASAQKWYLETLLKSDSLDYGIFPFGGNVNINYDHDGKEYAVNLLGIVKGSYFHVVSAEDYTPPGSAHPMKKVKVKFKIVLDNMMNTADKMIIEDGSATLLFTYQD